MTISAVRSRGWLQAANEYNQQSITRSGINTKNITINNEAAQQQLTGKTAEQIKSDILTSTTTDNAGE